MNLFPGRWLGAGSLIVAPLFLLAGELLKAPHHYYFPAQLEAFATHPARIGWAYGLWTVGLILLWPAFVTLASLISAKRPWLGLAAGASAVTGVLVNCFYEGINHLALELVEARGVEAATSFVAETYGWFSVPYALTWTDNLGWLLLGVGAYRAGIFGWFRALCVIYMAVHASGVLKGFTVWGVVGDVLLCVAFVSLGVTGWLAAPKASSTPA